MKTRFETNFSSILFISLLLISCKNDLEGPPTKPVEPDKERNSEIYWIENPLNIQVTRHISKIDTTFNKTKEKVSSGCNVEDGITVEAKWTLPSAILYTEDIEKVWNSNIQKWAYTFSILIDVINSRGNGEIEFEIKRSSDKTYNKFKRSISISHEDKLHDIFWLSFGDSKTLVRETELNRLNSVYTDITWNEPMPNFAIIYIGYNIFEGAIMNTIGYQFNAGKLASLYAVYIPMNSVDDHLAFSQNQIESFERFLASFGFNGKVPVNYIRERNYFKLSDNISWDYNGLSITFGVFDIPTGTNRSIKTFGMKFDPTSTH